MIILKTEVTGIGMEAESFMAEKIIILFGDQAPESLAEYCYHIRMEKTVDEISAGMSLCFDDQAYQITAVGAVVRTNLDRLGHITIQFDGSSSAELPGTLYVEARQMPTIHRGTVVEIITAEEKAVRSRNGI